MDVKSLSSGLFGVLLFASATANAQIVTSSAPALKVRDELIYSGDATPLHLEENYTTPVSGLDHITQFPAWKSVPRGFQLFAGVPLDIEGMICLWGEGNASRKITFPEERIGIVVNQKLDSLYVYHSAFFGSSNGVPVYSVVFRYQDGSSATNEVKFGEDIFDWRVKDTSNVQTPTAKRSVQAWVGGSFSGTGGNDPLMFTLTELTNPHSLKTVQTIDLYSCKSRTAPCIMAMTVGRAGLMKH